MNPTPDPVTYHLIGRVAPGPGPIRTAAEYWQYWRDARDLLRDAAQPDVPTADRLAMRDMAWELIAATKQVVNNPALHAEIRRQVEARLAARARAEGHSL